MSKAPDFGLSVVYDHEAEALDDLGALFEHWKRNRDKGRTPSAIRAAILMAMEEITTRQQQTRTKFGMPRLSE